MSPAVAAAYENRALLLGLESRLVHELKEALEGNEVVALQLSLTLKEAYRQICLYSPDIIFCPAAAATLPLILNAARQAEVPVVVVSRLPHASEWLDAMDAGAADYLAPPFDGQQLRWILESNCRRFAGRP